MIDVQRLRDLADALQGCEWEIPLGSEQLCRAAAEELERLRARIAELESALRPFASPSCADILDGMDDDEDVPMTYSAGTIRAAAAALENK